MMISAVMAIPAAAIVLIAIIVVASRRGIHDARFFNGHIDYPLNRPWVINHRRRLAVNRFGIIFNALIVATADIMAYGHTGRGADYRPDYRTAMAADVTTDHRTNRCPNHRTDNGFAVIGARGGAHRGE
jgi:hypothetical protein